MSSSPIASTPGPLTAPHKVSSQHKGTAQKPRRSTARAVPTSEKTSPTRAATESSTDSQFGGCYGSLGLVIKKIEGLDFGFPFEDRKYFLVGCRISSTDDEVDVLFEASTVVVAPGIAMFPAETFLPFPAAGEKPSFLSVSFLVFDRQHNGSVVGLCTVDLYSLLSTGDRVFGGPIPIVSVAESPKSGSTSGCAHVAITFFEMALKQSVVDHAASNLATEFGQILKRLKSPNVRKATSARSNEDALSTWDAPRRRALTESAPTKSETKKTCCQYCCSARAPGQHSCTCWCCVLDQESQRLLFTKLGLSETTELPSEAAKCSSRWSLTSRTNAPGIPTHIAFLIYKLTIADQKQAMDSKKALFHVSTSVDECEVSIGVPKILEVTPTGGTLTVELLTASNYPRAIGAVVILNELPPPDVVQSEDDTQKIAIKLRECHGKAIGTATLRISFLSLAASNLSAEELLTSPVGSDLASLSLPGDVSQCGSIWREFATSSRSPSTGTATERGQSPQMTVQSRGSPNLLQSPKKERNSLTVQTQRAIPPEVLRSLEKARENETPDTQKSSTEFDFFSDQFLGQSPPSAKSPSPLSKGSEKTQGFEGLFKSVARGQEDAALASSTSPDFGDVTLSRILKMGGDASIVSTQRAFEAAKKQGLLMSCTPDKQFSGAALGTNEELNKAVAQGLLCSGFNSETTMDQM